MIDASLRNHLGLSFGLPFLDPSHDDSGSTCEPLRSPWVTAPSDAVPIIIDELPSPSQLLCLQEAERRRIALDLHDGLGPLLTLIKLELGQASALLVPGSEEVGRAKESLNRAGDNIVRAFEELRRIVMDLRPAMLDDLGVLPTLSWLIRQFELSAPQVTIDQLLDIDENDVPADLKIVIFRVCQESLNNVLKHAAATRILISLTCIEDVLRLIVEDNGRGFRDASREPSTRSGNGVTGIMRRVTASGGRCELESAPGFGTRIMAYWRRSAGKSAAGEK